MEPKLRLLRRESAGGCWCLKPVSAGVRKAAQAQQWLQKGTAAATVENRSENTRSR